MAQPGYWISSMRRLIFGLVLYAVGSIAWILALSRLPLSRVYPFTIFTFVLVYVGSAAMLGESIGGQVLAGAFLVVVGLVVIATA